MTTPIRKLLFSLAALLLGVCSAWAHSGDFTRANVAVEADGRFTLTLNLDLLALAAEVPIVMAYMDYANKVSGLGPVFVPTGDLEADMLTIKAFYAPFKGKNATQFGT